MLSRPSILQRTALPLVLFIASAAALAHELPDDRVTIVQREPTHLSITFYIDEVALLNRIIAPKSSRTEFLLVFATLPSANFTTKIQQARDSFAAEIAIRDMNRRSLLISPLRWPTLIDTQRLVKESALALLATGSDHDKVTFSEINADATADEPLESIYFIKPRSLPELTGVSYRPLQQRMMGQTKEIKITF